MCMPEEIKSLEKAMNTLKKHNVLLDAGKWQGKILLAALIAVFCLFVTTVDAHGGVEKSEGFVTIFFNQFPMSPLVGETVKMNFVFKDKVTYQNLINTDVTLSVIDTFRGDESKDTVIFKKNLRTDVNGSFDFEYTFHKENYFDIELIFPDKKGQILTTGFLIQPRQANKIRSISPLAIFGVFIFGGIFMYALTRRHSSS